MPNTRVVCPTCTTPLELDAMYLGQEVECGSCNQIFVAKSQPRRDDDRPRRRADEDYDDDDDEDGRPRRRRRRRSAVNSNGTATTALVLGIVSLPMAFCCGLFSLPISIAAVVCGLTSMKGKTGRGSALAGVILGGIGLLLGVGLLILNIAFQAGGFGWGGGAPGGNPWNNNPPPQQQPFGRPRNFR